MGLHLRIAQAALHSGDVRAINVGHAICVPPDGLGVGGPDVGSLGQDRGCAGGQEKTKHVTFP
jgi:hypothetical protein